MYTLHHPILITRDMLLIPLYQWVLSDVFQTFFKKHFFEILSWQKTCIPLFNYTNQRHEIMLFSVNLITVFPFLLLITNIHVLCRCGCDTKHETWDEYSYNFDERRQQERFLSKKFCSFLGCCSEIPVLLKLWTMLSKIKT